MLPGLGRIRRGRQRVTDRDRRPAGGNPHDARFVDRRLDGAGISWLHRNAEVLNKELHDGRFDMTVRVDETKRDVVVSRFDAVPRVAT